MLCSFTLLQIIALFFSFISTIIWAYPPNIYYGMMAVVFTIVPLIASSIIVCCPNGACCCAAPKMFVIMGGFGCAMQARPNMSLRACRYHV